MGVVLPSGLTARQVLRRLNRSRPSSRPSSARHIAYKRAWERARSAIIRSEIIALLGGACVSCGSTDPFLEINHIYGRDWKPSKVNIYQRWLRYRREALAGLVDLRCPACNKAYRPIERPRIATAATAADDPF